MDSASPTSQPSWRCSRRTRRSRRESPRSKGLPPDDGGLLKTKEPPDVPTQKFKIETEDKTGLWQDVRGSDGAVLTFDSEPEARAKLAELFPVLVQMERYGGGKRTRVIRILADEDDWPVRSDRKDSP